MTVPPPSTNQAKGTTLKGAFDFQILIIRLVTTGPFDRDKKKEGHSKDPSGDRADILLFCPSPGK